MRSLVVALVIVLLASSAAFACGCAAPAVAYYPATPVVTYYGGSACGPTTACSACGPTTAYYPAAYTTYYPTYRRAYYPAYYTPVAARAWVGPLGRVRSSYYYMGW